MNKINKGEKEMTVGGWILMLSTELLFTVALIWCMRRVLLHKPKTEDETADKKEVIMHSI
ncbi:MAG: hypothetical protein LBQ66_05600 [Planctomycetaceae bacterium]|nr:hypothetical protein [Planctomycetaceae bacterium]